MDFELELFIAEEFTRICNQSFRSKGIVFLIGNLFLEAQKSLISIRNIETI